MLGNGAGLVTCSGRKRTLVWFPPRRVKLVGWWCMGAGGYQMWQLWKEALTQDMIPAAELELALEGKGDTDSNHGRTAGKKAGRGPHLVLRGPCPQGPQITSHTHTARQALPTHQAKLSVSLPFPASLLAGPDERGSFSLSHFINKDTGRCTGGDAASPRPHG